MSGSFRKEPKFFLKISLNPLNTSLAKKRTQESQTNFLRRFLFPESDTRSPLQNSLKLRFYAGLRGILGGERLSQTMFLWGRIGRFVSKPKVAAGWL